MMPTHIHDFEPDGRCRCGEHIAMVPHLAKMPAHTPGPWHVGLNGISVFGEVDHEMPLGYAEAPFIAFAVDEDAKANARLIAAAPALLEALEDVLSHTTAVHCPISLIDKARATIALAKGEAV